MPYEFAGKYAVLTGDGPMDQNKFKVLTADSDTASTWVSSDGRRFTIKDNIINIFLDGTAQQEGTLSPSRTRIRWQLGDTWIRVADLDHDLV